MVAVFAVSGWILLKNKGQIDFPKTPSLSKLPSINITNSPVPILSSTGLPAGSSGSLPVVSSMDHVVKYTDSGYSPDIITIKKGDTVTWENESSSPMWTASGVHPTHTVYSGTSLSEHCPDPNNISFDECQKVGSGQSWSFTFTKTGTWSYHNHAHASDTGTVIVK